jgi:hypothetical protein
MTSLAAHSFDSRHSRRAISGFTALIPGVVTDSIAVAVPALSMSASDFSMVQLRIRLSPKPKSFDAVM